GRGLSHVRRQDLHDRHVLVGGLVGDAFERIDTAEPDLDPVAAELVDRTREAFRDLAAAAQGEGSAAVDRAGERDEAGQHREESGAGPTSRLVLLYVVQPLLVREPLRRE